ncbi:hypothetical protein KTC82_27335, partial [Klebsiella pneumoniae]|nr:hypothetical protein [Klebsiella pneumoniae]
LNLSFPQNILYVVQGKDNPKLWKNIVSVSELHLINETSLLNNNYTASIRYRSQDTPVKVTQNENGYIFEFLHHNGLQPLDRV